MDEKSSGTPQQPASVSAGKLPPWSVGPLDPAPGFGLRQWVGILGPGVLLAGASIGTGEWLFGPAVSAQFGGTLLWLATMAIVAQVFCNLEVMRYTLYCGEPISVGYFRTPPGPWLWFIIYALIDIAAFFPFNASAAASALAPAILGHLPTNELVTILGFTMQETQFVTVCSYTIFYLSFLPLIFGGKIYHMLERIMTAKLIFVLIYLVVVCLLLVSFRSAKVVASGFVSIGQLPLRAETVIVGRHFTIRNVQDDLDILIKGTFEGEKPVVTAIKWKEIADGLPSAEKSVGLDQSEVPEIVSQRRDQLVLRARGVKDRNGFEVEDEDAGERLLISGSLIPEDRSWKLEKITVQEASGKTNEFTSLDQMTGPAAEKARQYFDNEGIEQIGIVPYLMEHRSLPNLDWAVIAGFIGIAGAGGMTNAAFSNLARDKGWGMGKNVGAIPSAIGGRKIQLSHVGQVFPLTSENLGKWKGWMRHIVRDQVAIWMFCSIIGMALPCMISIEFIRHAPVEGSRVSAMTADGMANSLPQWRNFIWIATLLCGFLVIAPGQVMAGDLLSRRWTDIIWSASKSVQNMHESKVKWIYYSFLTIYALSGTYTIGRLNSLQIATISSVLMNVALAAIAIHTLYVNTTLLPKELRPNLFMKLGLVFCFLFNVIVTSIVVKFQVIPTIIRLFGGS